MNDKNWIYPFFLILTILFGVIIITSVITNEANADFDLGDIRTFLENDETKNCEFISIQDGMFVPINFQLQFDASQNFKGIVEPLEPGLEYSEETNIGDNEGTFRFTTGSVGEFRITITDNMINRTNLDRNYFYRIEVSDAENNANIDRVLGNWNTDEREFCQIIEFTTEKPFKERTEEEILQIVEEEQKLRDEFTQELIDEVRASTVILAITFTLMVIYVGADKIFGVLNKGKAEKDMVKVKAFHTTEIERLTDMRQYMFRSIEDMKQDFKISTSIMHKTLVEWIDYIAGHKSKSPIINLEPKQNPYLIYHTKVAKFDLKKISKDILDKLQQKQKDETVKFVDEIKEKETEDLYTLYDMWQKKATDEPHNEDAQQKAKTILAELKERVEKLG